MGRRKDLQVIKMDFERDWKSDLKDRLQDNKKRIVVVLIMILMIVFLGFSARTATTTKPLELSFRKNDLSSGKGTTLEVRVNNIYDEDLDEITVSVKPESKALTFGEEEVEESNVGAGSYRKFFLPFTVSQNATAGRYKVSATAELGSHDVSSVAYLVVED